MKKVIIILVSILILINVIVGGFLFLDIQVLQTPGIHVAIDPIELTPDELVLKAQISIDNPNSFDISVENIKITSYTKDEYLVGQFSIPGGAIPANRNKTFIAQGDLSFNGKDYSILKNTIRIDIGINVFGIIKKTIPFEAFVDVSLSNITDHIEIPVFQIQAGIDTITSDGIRYSGTIDAYNPNAFEVAVENLSLDLKTEKNISVGTASIDSGVLKPAESLKINLNGTLLFIALDAESIHAKLTGGVVLYAAGIRKSLPFSVNIQFFVPNLISLLSLNTSFNFILSGDIKLRLQGVLCTVDFSIYNPSAIPLEARNLICSIFRQDKNETQLLGRQNMSPCVIEPKNTVCLSTQLQLPYRKFLFSGTRRILPDLFILEITGDISVKGVNQSIPITLTGNLSPHFLLNRNSTS
jgi:LEA14-like dessication related protein